MNSLSLNLLLRSLHDRRFSLSLIVLALAAAVALFISVQNVQRMTKDGFENTIANVDLVVAARGSDIQVLLNAVFGIGSTNSLMAAQSVRDIADLPEMAWHVPVSLGDSHKGFRVIGTTNAIFAHVLADGDKRYRFNKVLSLAVGADVAARLNYSVGDRMVLQHGLGDYGAAHDDLSFEVERILQRTNTPFDRAIFIPLQASEAIHRGWRGGRRMIALKPEHVDANDRHKEAEHHLEGHKHSYDHENEHHDDHDDADSETEHMHGPSGIDAVFFGLKDQRSIIQVQREVAAYEAENLMAVIPGITLSRIWQIIGLVDRGFIAINILIIGLVLLSMVAMTVLSADNRRREMSILRALGAAPRLLVGMLTLEALFISISALVLGVVFAGGLSLVAQDILAVQFGLMSDQGFMLSDAYLALYLVPTALLANIFPAMRLYRNSINDGIMVRR